MTERELRPAAPPTASQLQAIRERADRATEYRVVWKREGRPERKMRYATRLGVDIRLAALARPHDEHALCDHETGWCDPLPPVEYVRLERRAVGEWEPAR